MLLLFIGLLLGHLYDVDTYRPTQPYFTQRDNADVTQRNPQPHVTQQRSQPPHVTQQRNPTHVTLQRNPINITQSNPHLVNTSVTSVPSSSPELEGGGTLAGLWARWKRQVGPRQVVPRRLSLTQPDRRDLIYAHNFARFGVYPQASNMGFMVWNRTLEELAQLWARRCDYSAGQVMKGQLGQNIWASRVEFSARGMVESWENEKFSYNFANNKCSLPPCEHYTQIEWAESMEVGCGIHFCHEMRNSPHKNSHIVVCNYYKPGNVMLNGQKQKPYAKGEPCSNCPENAPTCDNRLCRREPLCGSIQCENHKTLATATCLCDCGIDVDNRLGPFCGIHPAVAPPTTKYSRLTSESSHASTTTWLVILSLAFNCRNL